MSIAEKLAAIAENISKVYKAGTKQGEGNIWACIQGTDAKRTCYDYGFRLWQGEYIRPKYKIIPIRGTGSTTQHLRFVFESSNIKKIESENFDFSNVKFNANSNATNCIYGFFRYCNDLEEIEDIGIGAGGYYMTFNGCSKLHTIAVMRCLKDGTYDAPFTNCTALKNIKIEGEIGNNLTFQYSPNLTAESAVSIIEALSDFSGTESEYTRTLTLNRKVIDTINELGAASPNGNTWIEYIDDKKWNLTVA